MIGKNEDLYLFSKLKKGDKKSFEKLFNKYYEPLCNFAFLFLKEVKLSEEIVDDVFVYIWNKRKQLEIKNNPKAYLYRSTRNAVFSLLRKNRISVTPFTNDELNIESKNFLPDTLLINSELHDKIKKIMSKMPKQAGLVFRLHKIDGMKYREIAEILNISIKTVENHMGKALRFFKEFYERENMEL